MKLCLRLLVCLMALGASCSSDPVSAQQRPRAPSPLTQITGQVRYAHGPSASRGILVRLEGDHSGLVGQVQTDSIGKFAFKSIAPEVYTVTVSYPGYREVVQRIDLTTTPTAYVVIELQPLPGTQPPSVPPEGAATALSVRLAMVPEAARKEFGKGEKLLESRNPKGSVASFQKAIQLYPSFSDAYLELGTAYMDMNKWKEAESALQKAIELDAKLGGAYLAMGICLNQQGKFADAVRPLLQALELTPTAAAVGHFELGRAYWALGRWPDAAPHARKAAELKPDLAAVHVLLGNILLRERDARGALSEFKEYLRLEPKGPLAGPTGEMVGKIEKALASAAP